MNCLEKRPVRILQIVRGSGSYGGVIHFLLTRYSMINRDKVHFDFLFCQKNPIDNEHYGPFLADSTIYELEAINRGKIRVAQYIKLFGRIKKVVSEGKYDYVHINTGSLPITALCLLAVNNKAITIAHSHSSNFNNGRLNTNFLFLPLKKMCQLLIRKKSDMQLACSQLAAENMFGENAKFTLMENAIDVNKFRFNTRTRCIVRQKFMCVEEHFVIGFVGRLAQSKNILFLLDVFYDLLQVNSNYRLWLVGDGEQKNIVETQINKMGINDKVLMFGSRNDVNELMQGMDAFVFPSLYEGLSTTVIEAQASGLPVYMSDSLSSEHKITDLASFLPLCESANYWAEFIAKDVVKHKRKDMSKEVSEAGYDLSVSVTKLLNMYLRGGSSDEINES